MNDSSHKSQIIELATYRTITKPIESKDKYEWKRPWYWPFSKTIICTKDDVVYKAKILKSWSITRMYWKGRSGSFYFVFAYTKQKNYVLFRLEAAPNDFTIEAILENISFEEILECVFDRNCQEISEDTKEILRAIFYKEYRTVKAILEI